MWLKWVVDLTASVVGIARCHLTLPRERNSSISTWLRFKKSSLAIGGVGIAVAYISRGR
jgi:hypothetical protein